MRSQGLKRSFSGHETSIPFPELKSHCRILEYTLFRVSRGDKFCGGGSISRDGPALSGCVPARVPLILSRSFNFGDGREEIATSLTSGDRTFHTEGNSDNATSFILHDDS